MMFLVNDILCRSYNISSMEWLFSESGHGKGAPDGIGAAVKRQADSFVAHGGSIQNAEAFNEILVDGKILTFEVN
jgi:hypothetical protein